MNALKGLKGKLGKGVELLKEGTSAIRGIITESVSGGDGRGKSAPGSKESSEQGSFSYRDSTTLNEFRVCWSRFKANAGERGDPHLFNLVMVSFDSWYESLGIEGNVSIENVLGENCGFVREISSRVKEELERLEWQLQTDGGAVAEEDMDSDEARLRISLCKLLECLLRLNWRDKDINIFIEMELIESIVQVLSDRLQAAGKMLEKTEESRPSTDHVCPDCATLDYPQVWDFVERLISLPEIADKIANVSSGKETISLLFDMATVPGQDTKFCRLRENALSTIRVLLYSDLCWETIAKYLQAYASVGRYVNRVRRLYPETLGLADAMKSMEVIIGYVKISIPFSVKVVEDFEAAKGNDVMKELILSFDGLKPDDEPMLKKTVKLLRSIIMITSEDARTNSVDPGACWSESKEASFSSAKGGFRLVRAISLDAMVQAFMSSTCKAVQTEVMDALICIYTSQEGSYELLNAASNSSDGRTMDISNIIESLDQYSVEFAESSMGIINFLAHSSKKPLKELGSLSRLLGKSLKSDTKLVLYKAVYEIASSDNSYRDLLRDIGLMNALIYSLLDVYSQSQEQSANQKAVSAMLIEALQMMCRGNRTNCQVIRTRCLPCFLQWMWVQGLHQAILNLLCQIAASGDQDDVEACIAGMCEALQSYSGDICVRELFTADVLESMVIMVEHSQEAKSSFRLYDGYSIVLSILVDLKGIFLESSKLANKLSDERLTRFAKLVGEAFSLLGVSTHEKEDNYKYLWRHIGSEILLEVLIDTGIFASRLLERPMQSILGMACGRAMCMVFASDNSISNQKDSVRAMQWQPEPLVFLIRLCEMLSAEDSRKMLEVIAMIASARPETAQALVQKGAIKHSLKLAHEWMTKGDMALDILMSLIATLGSVYVHPNDARRLFSLSWKSDQHVRDCLFPVLVEMSKNMVSSSFLRFSMEIDGFASAEIPISPDISWPPSAGYALAFWIRIENQGKGLLHVMHISAKVKRTSRMHSISVLVNKHRPHCMSIAVGGTDEICFNNFRFLEKKWYHVVIVHEYHKLQSSVASLFVNGQLRDDGKLKSGRQSSVMELLTSNSSADLTLFLGMPNNSNAETPCVTEWFIKGVMIIEEPIVPDVIQSMYRWGVSYQSLYQSDIPEGDVSASMLTAWRYSIASVGDSCKIFTQNLRSSKLPTDRIIFASLLCDGNVDGCSPDDESNTPSSTSRSSDVVRNMMRPNVKGGWLRGDASLVTSLAIADSLRSIGGIGVVVALVETVTNSTDLLRLLQLITNMLWSNIANLHDMLRIKGYAVLSHFLQHNAHFLTEEIVSQLLCLAGMIGTSDRILANPEVCKHLILDYRLWRKVDRCCSARVFEELQNLFENNTRRKCNAMLFQSIHLVPFLCSYLSQTNIDCDTVKCVVSVLEGYFKSMQPATIADLNLVAQLIVISKSSDGKSDSSGFAQLCDLSDNLIQMLLRLTNELEQEQLNVFCTVLKPMWFALLFQQSRKRGSVLALLKILIVMMGRNEPYCRKFRASFFFALVKDSLSKFYQFPEIYSALMQLMFANESTSRSFWCDADYCAANLTSFFSRFDLSVVVVPEAFDILLHLLNKNMKLELERSSEYDGSSYIFRSNNVEDRSFERTPSKQTAPAQAEFLTSIDLVLSIVDDMIEKVLNGDESVESSRQEVEVEQEISEVSARSLEELSRINCDTIQALMYLNDHCPSFAEMRTSEDVLESMTRSFFLQDDNKVVEEDLKTVGGTVSRVTGKVIKRLGSFLRMRSPEKEQSLQRVSPASDNNAGTMEEGWEDLGGTMEDDFADAEDHGTSELEYQPVLPGSSATVEGIINFYTPAGELLFQMLCCFLEGSIRGQAGGSLCIQTALESIPISASEPSERCFGGALLSRTCALLYFSQSEISAGGAELMKRVLTFTEFVVDHVCAGMYDVSHWEVFQYLTSLVRRILESEKIAQQESWMLLSRYLPPFYKELNRLVLHLLSRLKTSSEKLMSLLGAIVEHRNVIYGSYNNDATTVFLTSQLLFPLLADPNTAVRHNACRIWSHLLSMKRSSLGSLLSYVDGSGLVKSLASEGFLFLKSAVDDQTEMIEKLSTDNIAKFESWLFLQPSPVDKNAITVSAQDKSSRFSQVLAIINDNANKYRSQNLTGEQKYHAELHKRQYKSKIERSNKRRKQLKEGEEILSKLFDAGTSAREQAQKQWFRRMRSQLQNLESQSAHTMQGWQNEKEELLGECGTFGLSYSCLEDSLDQMEAIQAREDEGETPAMFSAKKSPACRVKSRHLPSVVTWFQGPSRAEAQVAVARLNRDARVQDRKRPPWWRLDQTEGPQRMRRRLEVDVQEMNNPKYAWDEEQDLYKPVRERFRKDTTVKSGKWESKEEKLEPDPITAKLRCEAVPRRNQGGIMSHLISVDFSKLLGADSGDGISASETNLIDHEKFLWLLEGGDNILSVFNCIRLSSGVPVSGVLLVCSIHVYVFDHCNVSPTGEVSMFNGSERKEEGEDQSESPNHGFAESIMVHRWSFSDIRDIQRRKYLLRPVGIELFTSDGLGCLLVFHKTERETVFESIWNLRQEVMARNEVQGEDKKNTSIYIAMGEADLDLKDSSKMMELAQGRWTGRTSSKTLLQNLRRLWQQGEISNLQYLMHLNTLAGRNYNDFTQYPIFPWVLRDYSSEQLDLTRPEVFRDLSKPMGAQDEARAAEYKKRFDNWLEPDPEHPTPPFHYATHYSSAAAVMFYLIRLEPFTSAHVHLQGGKFDHADRIFASVRESWDSASHLSLSDVKELIPEFYYLPDFLLNENGLDLGTRQKRSTRLDGVELPPWAHGSSDEFVRKMRQALESEYVSSHLHEWIDLIFGYRQRGPAAVEALNVFHHLTYEGAVDVDAIKDPVERMSTIAQILNFGQTPTQLFSKPHPKREQGVGIVPPQICTEPSTLQSQPLRDLVRAGEGIIRDVRAQGDSRPSVVAGNRILLPPSQNEFLVWGFPDGSVRLTVRSGSTLTKAEVEKQVGTYENLHQDGVTSVSSSDDGNVIVTGGRLGDICVWKFRDSKSAGLQGMAKSGVAVGINSIRGHGDAKIKQMVLRKRLSGHKDCVTCLLVSSMHSVIISGSKDRTVLLWDTYRLRFLRPLARHLQGTPACIDLNPTGSTVVISAGKEIRVVNLNGRLLASKFMLEECDTVTTAKAVRVPEWAVEYPVIISGHQSGVIRFWRLVPTKLARSKVLSGKPGMPSDLALDLLFECRRSHQHPITCISFSSDSHQLFTGDTKGVIMMWGKDRKSSYNLPRWLSEHKPDRPPIDERLIRSVIAQYLRADSGEEGSSLASTEVHILQFRISPPSNLDDVRTREKPSPSDLTWDARRTYAQFSELLVLLQRHGGVTDVVLPPKRSTLANINDSDEKGRQRGLEGCLNSCLQQCTARHAVILSAFIQAPDSLYDLSQSLLEDA